MSNGGLCGLSMMHDGPSISGLKFKLDSVLDGHRQASLPAVTRRPPEETTLMAPGLHLSCIVPL